MNWKAFLSAVGIAAWSVSCVRQNTGTGFTNPTNNQQGSAVLSQLFQSPAFSSTNYVIEIVHPPSGTNFFILNIQPNPTNQYAMRYVPR